MSAKHFFSQIVCSCFDRSDTEKPKRLNYHLMIPKSRTATYTHPNSIFNYPLTGQWELIALKQKQFEFLRTVGNPYTTKINSIEGIRHEFSKFMKTLENQTLEHYKKYRDKVDSREFYFNAGHYDGSDSERRIKVHFYQKKSDKDFDEPMPAFIYFHGGGGVALSVDKKVIPGYMARFVVDCNVKVFTVDYRLAPETVAPGGIIDAYAMVKYLIANCDNFKVDPERIAIGGESGGAYIAAGCAIELVKKNEGNLVKMLDIIHPMTSNFMHVTPFGDLTELERRASEINIGMKSLIATGEWDLKNFKDYLYDEMIFPNEMSEETAQKIPKTVIFTSEFDISRFEAEELAIKLNRNGTLLDFCCHPGTTHCWYTWFDGPRDEWFWNDQAKAFKKWLIDDCDHVVIESSDIGPPKLEVDGLENASRNDMDSSPLKKLKQKIEKDIPVELQAAYKKKADMEMIMNTYNNSAL